MEDPNKPLLPVLAAGVPAVPVDDPKSPPVAAGVVEATGAVVEPNNPPEVWAAAEAVDAPKSPPVVVPEKAGAVAVVDVPKRPPVEG